MKKYIKLASIAIMVIALGACSANETQEEPSVSPAPTVQPDPAMIESSDNNSMISDIEIDDDGEVVVPVSEPIDIDYGDSGYTFSLTEAEMEIYERLKEELTTDVFADVSPFTVAKIYIQSGIDSEWEAEWATFAEDTITVEKDDFRKLSEYQSKMYTRETRQGAANWYFSLIDEGFFYDFGGEGYIAFYQVEDLENEVQTMFNLKQNEKGIWEVVFDPLS